MYDSLKQDLPYLFSKFRQPTCPENSGMAYDELKKNISDVYDNNLFLPMPLRKAKAFDFTVKNIRIATDPRDFFPAIDCIDRNNRPLRNIINRQCGLVLGTIEKDQIFDDICNTGCNNSWPDFDHSAPDWERNIRIGFPGMRSEIDHYFKLHRSDGTLTPEMATFFEGVKQTYDSWFVFMDRIIECAEKTEGCKCEAEADCLKRLRSGVPQNFYDVLQFVYLYFIFSEYFDQLQVRTLGNLDNLLLPYYENDLKNGTFTDQQMRCMMDYFLMQWASINNYWGHPFYLGGTNADGSSRINKVSYLILEEFDKLSIPTPKIQLKIAKNTPDEFINAALKMIRSGNNSLVFVSEEMIRKAMLSRGSTEEDARLCNITGCYEFSGSGRHCGNGTAPAHLNLLKPFELIFNAGRDKKTGIQVGIPIPPLSEITTFDDFYRLYIAELKYTIDHVIKHINIVESKLGQINPSNVFSGSIESSLIAGKDGFSEGCYSNGTSMLITGIGSAADCLSVVENLIFKRKEITLKEMAKALADNWAAHGKLHAKIMAFHERYGNGLPQVDRFANMISMYVGGLINNRPNSRGGRWSASGHCAKQYFELGKKTGATPDGRYDGEEMSKNISPAMGADISGVTALIRSTEAIDPTDFPSDMPLDVMLHPSSIKGEDGLFACRKIVRAYLAHGLAIHFNIFDAEILKDAQVHPEKYEGLQIRVCGWNVHFTQMDKVEQDMYIRRAENISE